MKHLLLLILTGLLLTSTASGQMSQFKALFIYNFAKNVEWPSHMADEEIVISVLGSENLASELEKLARMRKVGNRSLTIEKVTNPDEIQDAHIVYLSDSKSSLMPVVASYQEGQPVLLVADKKGLCNQGAGISFFTSGGKLKFEVCPRHIREHGLKVSQRLISLGEEIR